MPAVESSSSVGATAGGNATWDVLGNAAWDGSTTAVRRLLRAGRRAGLPGAESFRARRTAAAAGVLESFATACRATAAGSGAGAAVVTARREELAAAESARWLAVHPKATAATMLAAQVAWCTLRRRTETSTAARRRRDSNGAGN